MPLTQVTKKKCRTICRPFLLQTQTFPPLNSSVNSQCQGCPPTGCWWLCWRLHCSHEALSWTHPDPFLWCQPAGKKKGAMSSMKTLVMGKKIKASQYLMRGYYIDIWTQGMKAFLKPEFRLEIVSIEHNFTPRSALFKLFEIFHSDSFHKQC